MRLEWGLLWPVPVTLDVPDATAEGLTAADRLALPFTHKYGWKINYPSSSKAKPKHMN